MAKITTDIGIEKTLPREEDLIQQGDFVFCNAEGTGAMSYWGIYTLGSIIALDGGGSQYVTGKKLYLKQTYNHWTLEHRIKCEHAIITINQEVR